MDLFWKDDINILFNKHRLIEFVPTSYMTVNEKLNAITRFMIYLGALLVIIYQKVSLLYITLIGMALIYIVHEHYPNEEFKDHITLPVPLTKPTKDNPFMNVLLTDYTANPNRGPAEDIDDPNVKAVVQDHFNQGLYRNIDNIWDRNNSQRQFYSNPATTIPNDRDSLMKWCWQTPMTCKDGNLSRCLRYEDTRRHGQIL